MDWRGFELHPETPAGGMELSSIFPGPMAAQFRRHLISFAAGFGITDMRLAEHVPSTRAALAVTEYAREQGALHAFKEAAMAAHYREGRDIEDRGVLARLARDVGLDPEAAAASADGAEYLARVDALRDEAHGLGVTGIPTFFFGDAPAVVGCEPYEVLARVAERAGARRR